MSIPQYIEQRKLPRQDQQKVMVLAGMYQRGAAAMESWAETAKKCVDFAEGRQWTAEVLRKLDLERRPHLTLNKIIPLVRLVVGYHRNNRSDTRALPGDDGTGSDETAEAISRVLKQIAENSEEPYVDAEVFLDGILTGRGFFDTRLDWERNVFGECKVKACDPFSSIPDPDAEDYNLDMGQWFCNSRRLSIDEVEWFYGADAAQMSRPFLHGQIPLSPVTWFNGADGEITPIRAFGSRDDTVPEWWDQLYNNLGWDFVDPYRKTFRVLDFQYWITNLGKVFIDLETGDSVPIPISWDQQRIDKALYHAQQVNNPLVVQTKPIRRVRWTTLLGDMMLYDDWSLYDGFTAQGFFPYFRRGTTKGMVDDLIDPQREINRRRSAEVEIVTRTANGGWLHHKDSLSPEEERKLERFGSRPGVRVKWKGEPHMKPEQIFPSTAPIAHEKLENKSVDDLRQIAGINESALGELDRVQSGRALEARQRQAVIAIQMYMDNFQRTKKLVGKRKLEIIQKHYNEPRIYRIMGENGQFSTVLINAQMMDPVTGVSQIVNDVTRGKYSVIVDDTPLSASFQNAQFEEALLLLKEMQTVLPPALIADILVDLSTLPRKDEIKARIQQAMGLLPAMPGAVGGGAPALGAQQPENAPSLAQGVAGGGAVVEAA